MPHLLSCIRIHCLAILRLLLAAAALWLACWGGTALYDRLTASPAKWQAEMTAGLKAESLPDPTTALSHYQAAVREARKFGPDDKRLAESLLKRAYYTYGSCFMIPNYGQSIDLSRNMMSECTKLCRKDPIDYSAWQSLLYAQRINNLLQASERDFTQAQRILARQKPADIPDLIDLHEKRMIFYRRMHEYKRSMSDLKYTLELKQHHYGQIDPRTLSTIRIITIILESGDQNVAATKEDYNFVQDIST